MSQCLYLPRGVVPALHSATLQRHLPLRLVLLGATGSIGSQTLDVIRAHSDAIELVAVAAHHNLSQLVSISHEFPSVRYIALADSSYKNDSLVDEVAPQCEILFGQHSVDSLAALDEIDCVLNALVGSSGMRASLIALEHGHELALANKESLVVAGDLIMPHVTPGSLFPVDSEHAAIFQSFEGHDPWDMARIWLTASGGPFFGYSRDQLANVTVRDTLNHPNWKMGAKVTCDSATLMNKGNEIIEAHHLFDVPYDHIQVVVQRQSIVHSMVEYIDGSVIAHLGVPDMRVPIQYALSYPHRWIAPTKPLDFLQTPSIEFARADEEVFGCLSLAVEAGKSGGTLPCVLNAADEVAVQAFLDNRIGFLGIEDIVEQTLMAHDKQSVESIEQLYDVDAWARQYAQSIVRKA